MYERQWFQPQSQVALLDAALTLEEHIRGRSFEKALKICLLHLNAQSTPIYHRAYWKRQIKRILRLEAYRKSQHIISVSFIDFWDGFDENNNETLNLLKYVCNDLNIQISVVNKNADLEIVSCFKNQGNKVYQNYGQTRILYLGENVRPYFQDIDYSLSFDIDGYCNRNIYAPLWILRNNLFGVDKGDYIPFDPYKLWNKRKIIPQKDKAVFVGNNSTPFRIELIYKLNQLGISVDCFGSQTQPIDNKLETIKDYKYSICVENSYHPGYVTEKLIDGYLANTIPIYWGGINNTLFNTNAFINLKNDNPFNNETENIKMLMQRNYQQEYLMEEASYLSTLNNICDKLRKIIIDLYLI